MSAKLLNWVGILALIPTVALTHFALPLESTPAPLFLQGIIVLWPTFIFCGTAASAVGLALWKLITRKPLFSATTGEADARIRQYHELVELRDQLIAKLEKRIISLERELHQVSTRHSARDIGHCP